MEFLHAQFCCGTVGGSLAGTSSTEWASTMRASWPWAVLTRWEGPFRRNCASCLETRFLKSIFLRLFFFFGLPVRYFIFVSHFLARYTADGTWLLLWPLPTSVVCDVLTTPRRHALSSCVPVWGVWTSVNGGAYIICMYVSSVMWYDQHANVKMRSHCNAM